MDIKWIFIDIDGTLIDSNYQISESNKKAVLAAVDKGVQVTIASGRMYRSVVLIDRDLGLMEKDFPINHLSGSLGVDIKDRQGALSVSLGSGCGQGIGGPG